LREAVATISNAMDVGNPSNFVRILELFGHNYEKIKGFISSYQVSDEQTIETIRQVFASHHYILDPHGAVGYYALEKYSSASLTMAGQSAKGLFLETAHPLKFSDVVEKAIGEPLEIPAQLEQLMQLKKQSVVIKPAYGELKNYLMA
jgi:threonine synthase